MIRSDHVFDFRVPSIWQKIVIIDFDRLNWLINRQISSTIEYYRLIDYIFDDRFRSINHWTHVTEWRHNGPTDLCLTSTYFQYNGKRYKQLHGTVLGSPVSVVVEEIVMQHAENAPLPPAENNTALVTLRWRHFYRRSQRQTLFTWLWRWLPLRLLKGQPLTTVLFRTTLTRTTKLYELITVMFDNELIGNKSGNNTSTWRVQPSIECDLHKLQGNLVISTKLKM